MFVCAHSIELNGLIFLPFMWAGLPLRWKCVRGSNFHWFWRLVWAASKACQCKNCHFWDSSVSDMIVHVPAQRAITDRPFAFAWLWGEIYDPARLLNEQIDRFVFDKVRCILERPRAPLCCVQLCHRQFFTVIRRGATLMGAMGLCSTRTHLKVLLGLIINSLFFYQDMINHYQQARSHCVFVWLAVV